MIRRRKPKNSPEDEVLTIEELKEVERNRLLIFIGKLFAITIALSFIAFVGTFIYLSIINNTLPSFEIMNQTLGNFFEVLKVIIGI